MMKSAGVFLATVLFALMIGTVSGVVSGADESGGAGIPVTASGRPDGDSGWGRIAQR
ncbi:hypothetical protein [Streptomyces sp. NPDC049916]|uniref:hypothetical protein n=1 Tax=Streptomyces sp. NPDC049916 TaxID=3155156 RepID=UPI00343A62AF